MLGNDTDPDGDALSASLITGPAHGALTLDANGSFAYRPAPNYNGPDSFSYRASDGSQDSNAATVRLTVTPRQQPARPTPPRSPPASVVMRLRVSGVSVFGRLGPRARCVVSVGRIGACSVRLLHDGRVVARGRAVGAGAPRRTVTLGLTAYGRALLDRRVGGVRVRARATARTTGGLRRSGARSHALLAVEHATTPPRAWRPRRAALSARGRRFVRELRDRLIAVAALRCDGYIANRHAAPRAHPHPAACPPDLRGTCRPWPARV